ncbi:MAG: ABC transporter substrate-binding protein [Cuspidothrix sp.]
MNISEIEIVVKIRKFYQHLFNSRGKFSLLLIAFFFCITLLSSCQSYMNKDTGVIHLTLWQSINPPKNRDVFNKLVDRFNYNHQNIKIDSLYAEGLPKILTAVVGNASPDILAFDPQLTGQFAELGAIVPLEEWLEKSPVKSEISPRLFKELELEGHQWSIPFYTSNIGIFYRHDLFTKAGISQPPKTWTEFREVAKKLTIDKNGDKIPEQYGMLLPLGKGEWTVFSLFPFLLSSQGEIVINNRPNLINQGTINALKFWEDLIKDGSATLSPPERGYEEDAFLSGRAAMQITGPWTYITKSKVDYQVFPIPADVTPSTVTGTGGFFIMKTQPEREKAAFKFLEFVLSEEFQTEWAIGTGFLPVNMKSAASPEYQKYLSDKPWLQVFVDQMSVAGSRPILAGYSRISDSLGRAIEETLLGKSSAEVALQAAQKRLEVIWPDPNS